MKIQHRLYAVCVGIAALLACWQAADYTAAALAEAKLAQAVSAAETAAERTTEAMARAIDADMAMMRAIAPTLSETDLVRAALSGTERGRPAPAAVSRANDFLRLAGGYWGVDRIWLLDAAGRCVVGCAGTADGREKGAPADTPVGEMTAERDYWRLAMLGGRFEGVRVKRGESPALYFSAPVYRDGLLVGVIAAQVSMTRLQHWVSARESLLTDQNGVIVLASLHGLEMHRVPDAAVTRLPAGQLDALYQRNEFLPLPATPYKRAPGRTNAWMPQALLARMVKFDERPVPYIVRQRESASSGLTAIALKDVGTWPALMREHGKNVVLFFLLYAGTVVIAALLGWIYLRERAVHRQIRDSNEALRSANHQLAFEASYDELTGSLTRRYFFHRFEQMLANAQCQDTPLGLIMADLDHFKSINDTHGHATGDQVLCRFVLACSSVLRGQDVIGRIGGEEFAILLPGATERDALRVAERMRACCKRESLESSALPTSFTASFGITGNTAGDTPITMIERADIALYRAKTAGRDRCWAF